MKKINIFFATMTGNAEDIAHDIHKNLTNSGHVSEVIDLSDFNAQDLLDIDNGIFVVSTWGDSEPPDEAIPFFEGLQFESSPGYNESLSEQKTED